MLIGGIVAVTLLAVAGAGIFLWSWNASKEERLAKEARKKYDDGVYASAQGDYEQLLKDHPSNEEYAFMVDLCRIRKAPSDPVEFTPATTLDEMATFLRQNGKSPLMPEHLRGLGETYVQIVRDHIIPTIKNRPDPAMMEDIQAAERTLAEFQGDLLEGVTGPERAHITGDFNRVREIIAKEEQRRRDLEVLRQLKPNQDGIVNGERLLREFGLQADPEARAIIEELYQQHIKSVTWDLNPAAKPKNGRRKAVDSLPTYLVDARVGGVPPNLSQEEGTVFALVRGVLYAQRQSDGAIKWAMRVGIDTTTLPVRVPATPSSPELILVVSADTYKLTALDMSGREMWEYQLSGPSLGRPVIIKNRAFFSTFDGQIHEIELAKGALLGRYVLGEGVKLSGGGVHWPETNLVFFPADEFCVYVIDVEEHACKTILYTKHSSGSLRGQPIIASWTVKDNGRKIPQGYLFLNLTESFDSMRLRAYALPIENPRGDPLPMNPEPRVHGWIWFPPHQDAEKVVQVTDDGKLALVGVKQKFNEDSPLFLLVPQNPQEKNLGIALEPLLKPDLKEKEARSRAQIAFAAEPDNFWVLAQGKLLRLRLLLAARGGPTVRAAWPDAIDLGSPLHEAQFFTYPFEAGGVPSPTLMLVTEPLNREVCLATAIDAENGAIRWQRQLGLVSRGEPVMLGQRLLALDQGGGLFTFDAARPAGGKDEWLVGSRRVAASLDDGESPPILVPGPDGKSAYEFAIPTVPENGPNPKLILRRIVDRDAPKPLVEEKPHELRAHHLALAGKPAINASGILVPLSDGSILRFNLDGAYEGEGPSWKVAHDDPETHTFIVWLNKEEFLTTHGGRNINRWQWLEGQNQFYIVPPQENPADPTIRMPANIATAPLAIPPANPGASVRALVACEDKTLYLIEGRVPPKALKLGEDGLKVVTDKKSSFKGKLTGGPFQFGDNILVIVDQNRLICLKPGDGEPLWEYQSEGDAIVGQPRLIEDMVLVSNQSGQFVGLDPKTGKPLGKGYTLKANVSPACSPVAFGKNQAFAPLTDGTVLLLDLNQLRK